MRALELLEGERVHRVVRAHPLASLRDYGPGLALLGLAGALALLLEPAGLAALDAALGPLAVPALLVAWWVGLGLATGPLALRAGAAWPLAYGVAVAVAGGVAAIVLGLPDPSAPEAGARLPWFTLVAALPPLALGEAMRRSEAWVFTNLRLVHRAGLLRPRDTAWRLPRLERVDVQHRGPKSLDLGDLVVASKDGPLRIPGIQPARARRDELELLLHTQPELPYLGDQRATAERVARLLRPGEAPPR